MELGEFVYKSNSANIAYYTEVDGPHWVSVLETNFDVEKTDYPNGGKSVVVTHRDVSTYHFSVYRDEEGIVKEFTYTPDSGDDDPEGVGRRHGRTHGNLDTVIVTNLMRREMA